jgi:seryl-tRNA synthetase
MIDINLIRENPEKVKDATSKKCLDPSLVDRVLVLDEKRRDLIKRIEELRQKRNEISTSADAAEEGKKLKDQLKEIEPELNQVEKDYKDVLWQIPNIIHEEVPVGPDESGNQVLRSWGEIPTFDFEPKDHMQIGESLGIIDTQTAAEVAGARFAYLKGDAVLLQFGLLQLAISVLTDPKVMQEIAEKVEVLGKPFTPVVPPVMIRPDVFDRMARLKPEDDRFYIQSDDMYLIGSAEHTLGPLHMDTTFSEKELPIRYFAFSNAFRREAGSYGKDTKGILRVHQFDKIEMESFSLPEDSEREQNFFVAIQEYLMQQLEIPYQVIAICTGDMGAPDYRQIDIESWLPGQDKYRETHTSDLNTDYQSRRLGTKVKRSDGTSEFVHMNDATVFAIGRTLIAILENYQQADGSVIVPKVLRKWVGKDKIGK